jgi:hypothetical protein
VFHIVQKSDKQVGAKERRRRQRTNVNTEAKVEGRSKNSDRNAALPLGDLEHRIGVGGCQFEGVLRG